MYPRNIPLFLIIIVFFFSCKRSDKATIAAVTPVTDTTQTYFSINQLIDDQIDLYYGQPFTLYRIATLNGKTDSSIVNVDNMDWAAILKAFRGADISDKKYLDHYKFSMFDDDATGNRILIYEALDPKLFTRQLQIIIDPSNLKILSIYIETAKVTTWRSRKQRLLYMPLKIIQVQEDEKTLVGEPRNLKVDYRFLQ